MYCNNCGKSNPVNSKFCKHCGTEIIKVTQEDTTDNTIQSEAKQTADAPSKTKPGLTGWLALLGLGLIFGVLLQGYGVLEYLPLLSLDFDIPGYTTLLQLEFLFSIIFTGATAYLLYLYFKKNEKFPGYYFIFLIASIVYVILDHVLLASLNAPTTELQNIINNTLSENIGVVSRTVIISVIWAMYIKKSKQVRITFINK